jgi:hypothetical protein
MDIKSHFREKVELSINLMGAREKAANEARVKAAKVADEATTMVLDAAGQLSREIAPYKSGISIKRRHDKIHNAIIISYKYYQYVEGEEPNMYIDLSRLNSIEGAERVINNMIQWCADRVADSRSARVRSIKFQIKLYWVASIIIVAFLTYSFIYLR